MLDRLATMFADPTYRVTTTIGSGAGLFAAAVQAAEQAPLWQTLLVSTLAILAPLLAAWVKDVISRVGDLHKLRALVETLRIADETTHRALEAAEERVRQLEMELDRRYLGPGSDPSDPDR